MDNNFERRLSQALKHYKPIKQRKKPNIKRCFDIEDRKRQKEFDKKYAYNLEDLI